jgi:hypothetical protein
MAGLIAPPSFLRQTPPPREELPANGQDFDLDEKIDHDKDVMRIALPDGSINFNFAPLKEENSEESKKHRANLAEHMGQDGLGRVSEELLRKIEEDDGRQSVRLGMISKGLELLGVKLEEPRSEPSEEGMSVIRHPLLLEAVMRFQANARGELLPADGPVKVRDDGEMTTQEELTANALAKDMNHYLTSVAKEYYPDSDRGFFSLGFGGENYKKVYADPIKRRPVAKSIDRKDLIISDGSVCIDECARVTHRSVMTPSQVKRMQIIGAWRDTGLNSVTTADANDVTEKMAAISGVEPKRTMLPEEQDLTIFECYCELDLPGFENKDGLQLPYRVVIHKESREVLEIRRWWREGDSLFLRKPVFVEYTFVPAFPGLNIGLLHILGNATRALTAAWRIALDNGILANFPGGVMARPSGKQQTSNIRVAPGQVAQIDTNGQPIGQIFANLPYRDVTPGFLGIVSEISQTAQRVGGTAETNTGEGRADQPVGTTIALIDQATKILSAVHKRIHEAQSKEFEMLRELFKEDPEALWRQNNQPNLPKNEEAVLAALNNADLVPAADPNTSSTSMRIQKAIAIKTLAMQSPGLYDMAAVDRRIMEMAQIGDVEALWNKNPPQNPMPIEDPAKMLQAQASMVGAQAKLADSQVKAKTAEADAALRMQDAKYKGVEMSIRAQDSQGDNANRAADRQANLQIEQMRLRRQQMIDAAKMHTDHVNQHLDRQADLQKHHTGLDHEQSQSEAQHEHDQQMQIKQLKSDMDIAKHQAAAQKAAAAARPKPSSGGGKK